MKLRPRSRAITALIALISMLFMQLAVAGYACPNFKLVNVSTSDDSSMTSMHQGMQGCHGMDKVQPNLCNAHSQVGTQSLDKPEVPLVQPFIAGALTTVFREIDIAAVMITAQPTPVLLTRATAPPLSIQHCCFRI